MGWPSPVLTLGMTWTVAGVVLLVGRACHRWLLQLAWLPGRATGDAGQATFLGARCVTCRADCGVIQHCHALTRTLSCASQACGGGGGVGHGVGRHRWRRRLRVRSGGGHATHLLVACGACTPGRDPGPWTWLQHWYSMPVVVSCMPDPATFPPPSRAQLWLGFRRGDNSGPDAYWRRNTGSLCLVAMIALGAVLTSGVVLAILLFVAAVAAVAAVAMFLHASKQRQRAAAAGETVDSRGDSAPTATTAALPSTAGVVVSPSGGPASAPGVAGLPSATCSKCGRTVIAPGPFTSVFRCACGTIVTAHDAPRVWEASAAPGNGPQPTITPVTSAARDTADSVVDTSGLVDLVRGQARRLTHAQLEALGAVVAAELSRREGAHERSTPSTPRSAGSGASAGAGTGGGAGAGAAAGGGAGSTAADAVVVAGPGAAL